MAENYGIKVSKSGNDVKTATADNIIMTSARNCLKVNNVVEDTISVNGSGYGTKTIFHGLDFVPFVIAIVDSSDNWGSFDGYYLVPFAVVWDWSVYSYLKITSVSFTLDLYALNNPNTNYKFYYFISETESAT